MAISEGLDEYVFHVEGNPQRCLYCLAPMVAALTTVQSVRCVECGLSYSVEVLAAGTEHLLQNADRYDIERVDSVPGHPGVPGVVITDRRADSLR